MERISIKQYADRIGVTRQAVLYRILNDISLPGVRKVEELAGRYILHINGEAVNKSLRKEFRCA